MTYNEADKLIKIHSNIIGRPILNHKGNVSDKKKITSLLISPKGKIQQVFSAWWYNGNDNEKALVKIKKDVSFEIFIISYNPADDRSIYYLRLNKYLELDELVS